MAGERYGMLVIVSGDTTLVDTHGGLVTPHRVVRRDALPALDRGDIVAVGGTAPLFAAAVGLVASADVTLTVPLVVSTRLDENGAAIVTAVRAATRRKDLGALRRLCSWFSLVALKMPEVHAVLDALPPARAEQIAGMRPGRGRRAVPGEMLGLIATLDLLVAERGLTVTAAAELLAKAHGSVSPRRLRNVHAQLGTLKRCVVEGYRVAESDAPLPRWDERAEDAMKIYVREFQTKGQP